MIFKVSVVIPVFNSSRYAKRISNSLDNNYERIYEVILINDGDSSDFEELIQNLEINNRHAINFVTFQNNGSSGPGSARNIGLDNARSNFVAFLDCDDEWSINSIRDRMQVFEDYPDAAFVYSNYIRLNLNLKITTISSLPRITNFAKLICTNYIMTPTVILNISKNNGLRFNNIGHEDFDLWLTILASKNSYAVCSEPRSVTIYASEGSLSANKREAFTWHKSILKKRGFGSLRLYILLISYFINGLRKRKSGHYSPTLLWMSSVLRISNY